MGDVKAHAERDGHGNARGAGALDHGLADRIEDDEAGVAENGDRDDPAHDQDRQLRFFLADEMDDHVRKLDRCTGFLEQGADQGAEDDDDTNAGECAGETGPDDIGDAEGCFVANRLVDQGHTGNQAEDQRDAHDRQEGMDLEFGNCEDHDDDGDNEGDEQWYP